MSYDWHFSDGSHNKMSNWAVHSAIMLTYHAVGVWSYERLESELTAMQMHRNEMNQMANEGSEERSAFKGDEPINIIITVEKLSTESELIKEAIKAGAPVEIKDGIAYIAKVQFKSDAPVSKEFMEEWTKSMEGHLKYAIKNTMRCEELFDEAPEFLKPTLKKVLANDGFVFNQKDADTMAMAFMGIDKKITKELEEVLAEGWQELILMCLYAGANNLTARIY